MTNRNRAIPAVYLIIEIEENCSSHAGAIRVTKMVITKFPQDMSNQGNFLKNRWYVKQKKKLVLLLIQQI